MSMLRRFDRAPTASPTVEPSPAPGIRPKENPAKPVPPSTRPVRKAAAPPAARRPPAAAGTQPSNWEAMTNRMLQCLDEGRLPWRSDVPLALPRNGISGRPYHGANIPLLMAHAMAHGYADARWTTFEMANKAGWRVRKDEHGTDIYAHRMRDVKTGEDPETGEPILSKRLVLCRHRLFNYAQLVGAPDSEEPKVWDDITPAQIERIEAMVNAMGAHVVHRKGVAQFVMEEDEIRMPPPEAYPTKGAYYNRLVHELAHWTGHPGRLNREAGRDPASPHFAKEELIADLATAMVCSKLGLPSALEDHPSFVDGYRALLQSGRRVLWNVARDAEHVATQILGHDLDFREELREEAAAMAADAAEGNFGDTFDGSIFEFNDELFIDAHAATASYQP